MYYTYTYFRCTDDTYTVDTIEAEVEIQHLSTNYYLPLADVHVLHYRPCSVMFHCWDYPKNTNLYVFNSQTEWDKQTVGELDLSSAVW